MTQEDPDRSLVQALKAGRDQALNALMDRHRKGLFHFVFRHIPNEADALELTAEAFVRAYFNIGRFRPSAKFVTWLYRGEGRNASNWVSPVTEEKLNTDRRDRQNALGQVLGSSESVPQRTLKIFSELPQDPGTFDLGDLLEPSQPASKIYRTRQPCLKKMRVIVFSSSQKFSEGLDSFPR